MSQSPLSQPLASITMSIRSISRAAVGIRLAARCLLGLAMLATSLAAPIAAATTNPATPRTVVVSQRPTEPAWPGVTIAQPARWAGVVVVLVVGLFALAAGVGVVIRYHSPADDCHDDHDTHNDHNATTAHH
jgi:hypothetical protein